MIDEYLDKTLRETLGQGYRNDLLAKGQSRSIIMRDGGLPEGHPNYPKALSYNLLSFGYGVLSMTLKLSEVNGDDDLIRRGFEQAGNAIEASIVNSDRSHPDYGFHITVAACAFHLGRFSARAYSLLEKIQQEANTSPIEKSLALLMRRSIDQLNTEIFSWCTNGEASDEKIRLFLEEKFKESGDVADESAHIEAINLALTGRFFGSLGTFLLALETGQEKLFNNAIDSLQLGLECSAELNLVPPWWAYRLAIQLVSDLWNTSFHKALPKIEGSIAPGWDDLRMLFIASMYCRSKAEIELWPSQLEAAKRSVDTSDNLIASLPTSSGKTRISELAILRCLSESKRVVFVTPLRALSAQTELTLHKTFSPLGYTISALYGSIGTSQYEEDVMKDSHIVVATPEKIDFALRNDPEILDDIGLVVLDEGHMIGLNEREIRYETQIQRLLKRPDANQRRIVCLSAILPDGDEFEDFVSWLRRDEEGEAITSDWRPTRLRFGELQWQENKGRGWLELEIAQERSFVPTYISAISPQTPQRKLNFPKDQHELVIATTWKLINDGHSVLIFCPLKKSVEPYAERIIKAHKQGFIRSLLEDDDPLIKPALSAGKEWLGEDHSILKCLKLGVAIHHGSLPTPFRREVEKLLRQGVLRVTVSSPTLAQGLNLSATTVLFHSLHRNRELIKVSEFKNIIGRAGRAFIDVEGLILYPMFDNVSKRQSDWNMLRNEAKTLSLESGLLRLVISLLIRIQESLGDNASYENFIEYVLNNANVWDFPNVDEEEDEQREQAEDSWSRYITFLDTSILNLLGDTNVSVEELSNELDRILASSLWERRLNRRSENIQSLCNSLLIERSKYIWNNSTATQRKGYYLAGVGLSSGHQLDGIAEEANELLVKANEAIHTEDDEEAISAFISLAEILFEIKPFIPKKMVENWRELLDGWLRGQPMNGIVPNPSSDILDFVEDAFVYRLPWGLEAIKVRAKANEDKIGDFPIDDFDLSVAVPALETGTINMSAAVLIQSGFPSRIAAISAVQSTNASFVDVTGLKEWLASDEVNAIASSGGWPTVETAPLWSKFTDKVSKPVNQIWKKQQYTGTPVWDNSVDIEGGGFLRLRIDEAGKNILLSEDYSRVGELQESFPANMSGLLISEINSEASQINFTYYGEEIV